MLKSLKTILKQDKEKYKIPRSVRDVIPIECIWKDGIFKTGNRYSKTFRFNDINYMVASKDGKESMFLRYAALLNSLDSSAITKLTIYNHRMNKCNFEKSILMEMRGDDLDIYRKEYNNMLLEKATNGNGIVQEKMFTVSIYKSNVEEARTYFIRVEAELATHFAGLGSRCFALEQFHDR